MESAIIGTFVGKLSSYLKENKSFSKFIHDFADATIDWIRPLFLNDSGEPKKAMKDLETSPDDSLNQDDVKTTIAKFIRENPNKIDTLKLLIDKLDSFKEVDSKITIKQSHFGTGDNVGHDKIVK